MIVVWSCFVHRCASSSKIMTEWNMTCRRHHQWWNNQPVPSLGPREILWARALNYLQCQATLRLRERTSSKKNRAWRPQLGPWCWGAAAAAAAAALYIEKERGNAILKSVVPKRVDASTWEHKNWAQLQEWMIQQHCNNNNNCLHGRRKRKGRKRKRKRNNLIDIYDGPCLADLAECWAVLCCKHTIVPGNRSIVAFALAHTHQSQNEQEKAHLPVNGKMNRKEERTKRKTNAS